MTSKGAKDTIVTKLGFKSSSSSSKAEAELEKVRKENAHLRKKIDELAKRHIKPPDSDKSKLLERILSLETLRERNNQQLLVKEQELETLRQQLSARGGEQNGQVPSADLALVQAQLRDALEKNQQWLAYDQQREVYVQSVVARTLELEQQLAQPKQQQTKHEAAADAPANTPAPEKEAQLKSQHDQLLMGMQKELESQKDEVTRTQQELKVQMEQTLKAQAELKAQKEQFARLQEETSVLQRRYQDKCSELSSFLMKYEEKSKEVEETKMQLQAERLSNRHAVCEERKGSSERADRMKVELENMGIKLEEERKRSAELLLQVNMLQKSLLSQNEERRRVAALEQQIQLSAKDFENEKIDRQNMQQQLHKVLKELRKAREQIANLESAKQPNARFSEPNSYNKFEFERLTINDPPGLTSPSKAANLLDESFLECPKCHTPYPTSRHRELLAHIDYCFA
ncbi:centrosomal protein of 55 kDa isoform X3 [Mastacembelus armatus]|uniref:centrosomal protein of 55 kDa isoform X3 n=1 Tax=Mastacembelus armatus TaxID=205130 RepID=UPI000E46404D|nr:centrosomal protein of 55 kDa isoform X3 [Mastacembelus armatus]